MTTKFSTATPQQQKELREKSKRMTARWAAKCGYTGTPTPPKNGNFANLQKEIEAVIDNSCHHDECSCCNFTRELGAFLLSRIEGMDLEDAREMMVGEGPGCVDFIMYTMVVPLVNETGHSYDINKPALCIYGKNDDDPISRGINMNDEYQDVMLKPDGSEGNRLGRDKKHFRPATDAEIDAFFDELFGV